jgi:putative PIN family toxin of toxin-antitoxin system
MRVIIDTNILISAVLKGRKPREIIEFIVNKCDIQWIVSQEIITEYKDVLNRRKLKLTPEIRQEWLDKIETIPLVIDVEQKVNFPRDQKDAKFLECAIASNADFLITGDRDFEEIKKIGNTLIISVSLFKDLFIDNKE